MVISDSKLNGASKQNVILFPKTYEYYQMELTRLLESERYSEAVGLLRFLLQCDGEDEGSRMEWAALYEWLLQAFPDLEEIQELHIHRDTLISDGNDEEPESEQEVLKMQMRDKLQLDNQYIAKLLQTLRDEQLDERKWLVLEQLAVVDDETLNDELIYMLETEKLHSLVQFGLLQTLNRRGTTGAVTFFHGNEQIVVDIEHTPMDYASFPYVLQIPAEKVHDAAAVREPSLAYFSQEMWQQFLKAIYGTALYDRLRDSNEQDSQVWAAALHRLVAGLLHLEEEETEVKRIYNISGDLRIPYEQALRALANSLRSG
ncbi:hypothetical protein MH117_22430 [Paenibacillus sp. ACRRX]|nr:hypothetical protein [Paenibacillus sp. ACRRX]MDK8183757.1 hypothetical protein [Paenibacillus sp. UMB4589-SE434]